MIHKILLLAVIFIFGSVAIIAQSPTPEQGIKPSVAMGDVVSIDKGKIVIQTKDGSVDIALSEKTEYKRISPDNLKLSSATASNFSDIAVGDKLAVQGVFSADKKSMPARAVYLITKTDLAQKQAKESEEWKTRGITGKVTSVNPQTNQISVEVRGMMSNSTVVLSPKENADYLRYAPGSVKYSEAQKSSFAEVKVGDSLRAVGEKGADGTTFTAEKVLTGAFQTVAGTIKSIDAAKGEVVITDIQTKKDVTIAVNSSSLIKKFPEEQAQRMAQFQAMRAGGMTGGQGGTGGVRPPQGMTPPAGGNPAGGEPGRSGGEQGRPGGGFGGGMRAAGGIDEMLDRFPSITVADLKVGDMIAASSTKTSDTTKITAIKLLAGVEPFLKTPQIAGGGRSGGQGSGGQGGFTIPGLDGVDAP